MISVYNIKPQFQRALTPVLKLLRKLNISANRITVSAGTLSLAIGVLFWFADHNKFFLLALPVGLLIRMALNALDGMMARKYDQVSKTGEMLNEVGDVVSDVMVFFPLLKFQPESLYLIVIFIVMSVINEFAGVMGKIVSGKRRYEGPMGKSDRAFLLGVYGVLALAGIDISGCSRWIFIALILLLTAGTALRIKKAFDITR